GETAAQPEESGSGDSGFPPPPPPGEKPEYIVFNSSGGIVNEALRAAYFTPFEEFYGVKVVDTSPVDFGKLKAMVESGNVEWDVTEIGGQDALRAADEGLLEPLDFSVIDVCNVPDVSYTEYALRPSFYSTVIGYREDVFPNGTHPKTWAEFWD